MKRVPLVRAGYFVWLVVPLAIFAFVRMQGLPHVIWSYDWQALGPDSFADQSQRHYTRCSYVGPHGLITEYPSDGKCGWVRFARKAQERS